MMLAIENMLPIGRQIKFLVLNYVSKGNARALSTTPKVLGVHASLEIQDRIGIMRLKSPGKVNVINLEVAKDFQEILSKIENDSNIIGGVIISDKPECFIAGADVNLISTITTPEKGTELSKFVQDFLHRVERSKKPFVAAIMGSCLGGGLEVALACHYRVAVQENSVFSFPEVLLGLLPGAGGTQRLPKLIGLPNALDMMLTGRNIRSEKAKSMGLVDQLINSLGPGLQTQENGTLEYLKDVAVQRAKEIATGNLYVRRGPKGFYDTTVAKALNTKFGKDYVFKQARSKVMKQTKGLYPAPLKILDCVRTGLDKGDKAGYASEAAGFGYLSSSNEAKGLISLFHGQAECKRNKLGESKRKINIIGVLGAGLMGAGIADVSIRKGYQTILKDTSITNLMKGEQHVQDAINLSTKKRKITNQEGDKYLSNLITTTDFDKFSKADIVIEAVYEDIGLKQRILKEVENATQDHCVYATNTSALLVSEISEASKRPDKVIGMHYFSPVDKMMLLEIVTTDATSEETLKVALDVGLKQGKTSIVVKDGPGFYTTRVMMPMIVETFRLMCEGVEPTRLDALSMNLGFPVGCVTLSDEVGIDVGYHVYCYFVHVFGDRMKSASLQLGQDIMDAGFYGRKCGKGAYIYKNGSKGKTVNQTAMDILQKYRVEPKMPLTDDSIKFRLISRFINEAVLCLQNEVVSNPLEGDVGAVFGLGFPPFTGGPFHYIDRFGANKFVDKMREVESFYGPNFTPCDLLVEHAKDTGKRFFI